MAIYIQINKTEEDRTSVVYEFGPCDGIVGQVILDKTTGVVELLDIAPEAASRKDFYVPRVRRTLDKHFCHGEFPDCTSYQA